MAIKRAPRDGERALLHGTWETDDWQEFALVRENYDPVAISHIPSMQFTPVSGYQLLVSRFENRVEFTVYHNGAVLSRNTARCLRSGNVRLETTILSPMASEESLMLADLEQCAAIGLLGIQL